jgi:hypothetical protein
MSPETARKATQARKAAVKQLREKRIGEIGSPEERRAKIEQLADGSRRGKRVVINTKNGMTTVALVTA